MSGLAKAGVAGVYNRALYLEDRRLALQGWAKYVDRLTTRASTSAGPLPSVLSNVQRRHIRRSRVEQPEMANNSGECVADLWSHRNPSA